MLYIAICIDFMCAILVSCSCSAWSAPYFFLWFSVHAHTACRQSFISCSHTSELCCTTEVKSMNSYNGYDKVFDIIPIAIVECEKYNFSSVYVVSQASRNSFRHFPGGSMLPDSLIRVPHCTLEFLPSTKKSSINPFC